MRPYLYLAILGASITAARIDVHIPDYRRPVPHVNPHPVPIPQQAPMNPSQNDLGPVRPEPPANNDNDAPEDGQLTISDILPSQRQINIFAQLTRDIESLTARLESSAPASNTTLLAPLNSVMQALPRKPWEDRPDDTDSVSAEWSSDKASGNLKRFVLEHVVPVSPWKEGKENAVKTLWGQDSGSGSAKSREIWWETRKGGNSGNDDRKVIMPGEIVVDRVAGKVGNGEIWSLKGVINYE